MPLFKNVASQKLVVWAWDRTAGAPKTGDKAQITAQISKDSGASAASDDANPEELDATDHPGVYVFDLAQAETNCDLIVFTPSSSTGANIVFDPRTVILYTTLLTSTKAGYLDASISDVPTVAEFEARSIVAANYVVVGDTIAGVTTVANDVGITQGGADKVWSTAARILTANTNFNDITVANIIAGISDGTFDLQEMMRIVFAVCCCKSNGGGTVTINFRDSGDGKNRVTATVDSDGNRTAVTLDGS